MASFLRHILTLVLGIVLPLTLQWWLRSRMSEARRERGWTKVSWAFALYAVGPFSMIPFAWVTRRHAGAEESLRALGVGVAWTVAILVALFAIDAAYALALGLPV